jgi:fructose 1,6-bisphosphate aldolase/phosphatase
VVSALAFSVHRGKLTKPVDAFDHPFWDAVRERVATQAVEIRRPGFSGPAMLPMTELEYGGITERLQGLEQQFHVRKPETVGV